MGCNCSSLTESMVYNQSTWMHADGFLFTSSGAPTEDLNEPVHVARKGNFTPLAALLYSFDELDGQAYYQKAHDVLENVLRKGIIDPKNATGKPYMDVFVPLQSNGEDAIMQYCLDMDHNGSRHFLKLILDAVDDDPRLGEKGKYFIKLFEEFQRYDRRTLGMAQNNPNVQAERRNKFQHCVIEPLEILLDHNVGFAHQLDPTTQVATNTALHELFSSSVTSGFSPEFEVQVIQSIISSGKNLSSLSKVRDRKLNYAPLFVAIMCGCPESISEICANAAKFGIFGKEDLVDQQTGKTVFHFAFGRERVMGQSFVERDQLIYTVVQTLFTLPGANDVKNISAAINVNGTSAMFSPLQLAVQANNHKTAELLKLNGCQ